MLRSSLQLRLTPPFLLLQCFISALLLVRARFSAAWCNQTGGQTETARGPRPAASMRHRGALFSFHRRTCAPTLGRPAPSVQPQMRSLHLASRPVMMSGSKASFRVWRVMPASFPETALYSQASELQTEFLSHGWRVMIRGIQHCQHLIQLELRACFLQDLPSPRHPCLHPSRSAALCGACDVLLGSSWGSRVSFPSQKYASRASKAWRLTGTFHPQTPAFTMHRHSGGTALISKRQAS